MAIITYRKKCTGCGICVKVCPQKILELDKDRKIQVLNQKKCMSCYGCEDECKFNAVVNKKSFTPDIPEEDILVEKSKPVKSEYDIIIVGAGPAGLGAAISCARLGMNTALFERLPNRQVSHHNDGGVLFNIPSVTDMKKSSGYIELPKLDLKLADKFIESDMEWLGLYGPEGYNFDDKFTKGMKGYICSKDRFVHELVNEAEKAGAHIFYGTRVDNVIRENETVTGIRLYDGRVVRSKAVVAADGILGNFSSKIGIPVNKNAGEYLQYLTLFYERPEGLKSGFVYLFGDMKHEDSTPAVGGLGIAEHIEISLILYSKNKFYSAQKPMDEYITEIISKDSRIKEYLGDHLNSLKLINIRGTRLRLRNICKNIAINGAAAIGDTWVSGAQLGNINALAHGIYTGEQLKKAFEENDFSKDSLNRIANFIDKDTEMTIKQMSKMVSYPVKMDKTAMVKYCEIFHSTNYPTFFYGTKSQIIRMVVGCMLRNITKLVRYPKIFKYL